MNLQVLLEYAVFHNASDLHLAANDFPIVRIDGDLVRLDSEPKLTDDELYKALLSAIPEEYESILKEKGQIDFSYALENVARFRVNIFKEQNGISAVFRVIPLELFTLEQLGAPPVYKALCEKDNGLILVTGPTGSGKSTTLAAMIDYVNQRFPKHVITIEDPVEFIYKSKCALIRQREVHRHTASFNDALRAVLREDPDMILVGEMRDLETIRLALTAAETGHLVFATLHTNSAAKSINRIVDVFPAAEKDLVRMIMSETLQAIISQKLLKKAGGGRVAASEIMVCNNAIRSLIRENKVAQIYSAIQTGRELGMRTMEQAISQLEAQNILASGEQSQTNTQPSIEEF